VGYFILAKIKREKEEKSLQSAVSDNFNRLFKKILCGLRGFAGDKLKRSKELMRK